jgi:hypothetical protein
MAPHLDAIGLAATLSYRGAHGEWGARLSSGCYCAQVREALLKNIKRRMTPQPLKVRADVEMTCFTYDGIEHIKSAIRAAEAQSAEECPVKMKLVAPPLYVLTTQTLDKNKGIEVLTAGEAHRRLGVSPRGAKPWGASCNALHGGDGGRLWVTAHFESLRYAHRDHTAARGGSG